MEKSGVTLEMRYRRSHPPPLQMIRAFCRSVQDFLEEDEANTII